MAGVRPGATPDAEWQVVGDITKKNTPGYFYSSKPEHWGTFQQFETPNGSRVVVEHTDDPAGPHFHAGQPKNDATRQGVNFGWDNSQAAFNGSYPDGTTHEAPFERYGKIDKPWGGDHHLFYD
ncbi:HNH/endonuclease VII fold putative polymorphic toxin [Yinghuangia seranimata]|uniref:HNH/endonuclease VII fold putative polymorphic toxin n=1 Tax=Yinghuangia seranimata TaxID=408067 RepID=UPI003CCF7271